MVTKPKGLTSMPICIRSLSLSNLGLRKRRGHGTPIEIYCYNTGQGRDTDGTNDSTLTTVPVHNNP